MEGVFWNPQDLLLMNAILIHAKKADIYNDHIKTKPTKTNITIQTYRTKHTEPKLLDQTKVTNILIYILETDGLAITRYKY